ncbi:MAG: TIGR02466 family protein [Aestuariivirga sp.]
MKSAIESLFPTLVYRTEIPDAARLNLDLEDAALSLRQHDTKGLKWCAKHGYAGYTSYASIDDLSQRSKPFARLEKIIHAHAAVFAKSLHWNLRGQKPLCDSMWVNVLPQGGSHTSHIHTNAVLSGTYYVTAPEGSSPIVFEDPRHAMMMAAPPRKTSIYESRTPRAGTLMLWESWLRHEVPMNRAREDRISVSFNCVIG